MASKKLGNLIKEARTEAGLTQEQLARKIAGLSASDISAAERGVGDLTQEQLARKIAGLSASDISAAERGVGDLTQDQLKKIAKVTGVTQASLLNAAKGTAKKSTSTAAKSSMQVTAAEKKLVELYRAADSATKKEALKVLKGEDSLTGEILESLLDNVKPEKILESLIDTVQDQLGK